MPITRVTFFKFGVDNNVKISASDKDRTHATDNTANSLNKLIVFMDHLAYHKALERDAVSGL